jgi:hypothetical protein
MAVNERRRKVPTACPAERDAETLLATILEGIGQPSMRSTRNWRVHLYNALRHEHFGRSASGWSAPRHLGSFPAGAVTRARATSCRRPWQAGRLVRGRGRVADAGATSPYCMSAGRWLGVIFRDVNRPPQGREKRARRLRKRVRKRTGRARGGARDDSDGGLVHHATASCVTSSATSRAIELLRMPREVDSIERAQAGPRDSPCFRERDRGSAGRSGRCIARRTGRGGDGRTARSAASTTATGKHAADARRAAAGRKAARCRVGSCAGGRRAPSGTATRTISGCC